MCPDMAVSSRRRPVDSSTSTVIYLSIAGHARAYPSRVSAVLLATGEQDLGRKCGWMRNRGCGGKELSDEAKLEAKSNRFGIGQHEFVVA